MKRPSKYMNTLTRDDYFRLYVETLNELKTIRKQFKAREDEISRLIKEHRIMKIREELFTKFILTQVPRNKLILHGEELAKYLDKPI